MRRSIVGVLFALVCLVTFAEVAAGGPVRDFIRDNRPGWLLPKNPRPQPVLPVPPEVVARPDQQPQPAPVVTYTFLPVGQPSIIGSCPNGRCPLQR